MLSPRSVLAYIEKIVAIVLVTPVLSTIYTVGPLLPCVATASLLNKERVRVLKQRALDGVSVVATLGEYKSPVELTYNSSAVYYVVRRHQKVSLGFDARNL